MAELQKKHLAYNEPLVDEYHTEGKQTLTGREFWVYRQLGKAKINYCQARSLDAALSIARALNIVSKMDARMVQEFPFEDGGIFIVVKGSKTWELFLEVAPIFERSG
jgi:hypothetical protein